jgi:hypothetical protein
VESVAAVVARNSVLDPVQNEATARNAVCEPADDCAEVRAVPFVAIEGVIAEHDVGM